MSDRSAPEWPFVPRVINPVKLERALLLAADSRIRESRKVLEEKMAWLKTEVLSDPQSVPAASSDQPSVFLFDDAGLTLVDPERVRAGNRNAVLVLLSSQPFIHCAPPRAARERFPHTAGVDLVFAVDRRELLPENIVLSAVRAAEDRLNIEQHTGLKRFIFHVIDDEPRWFSQFLPLLYEIIGQRADVMITRTYEESRRFLFGGWEEWPPSSGGRCRGGGHADDVVCLITDVYFPKGAELQIDAGRDLIRLVNSRCPRIPVIIASKAEEARDLSPSGLILRKGDPGSLEELKKFILRFTGMGDFYLLDEEGRELRRARNIREICGILREAEGDDEAGRRIRSLLEAYGEKDKFSTWLYMHGYRELGDRLRPKRRRGKRLISLLIKLLEVELSRMARTPLDISGIKAFDLAELLAALRTLPPDVIQPYSDNDVLSSWLDRKGYPELAEELRPVHGSGPGLKATLTDVVSRWLERYRKRGEA